MHHHTINPHYLTMKDLLRIIIIGTALCSCLAIAKNHSNTPQASTLSAQEISWVEFCKARHYDPHTEDEQIIDEFLDTWVGSCEEENALTHIPSTQA